MQNRTIQLPASWLHHWEQELQKPYIKELKKKYGDESVETAKAWYWYADALITKEEECADDILGDAAAEAKAAVASMVAEMQATDGEANAVKSDDEEDNILRKVAFKMNKPSDENEMDIIKDLKEETSPVSPQSPESPDQWRIA